MAKDVLFFTLMYLLTVFSVRDLLHLQLSSLPAAFLIHSQHCCCCFLYFWQQQYINALHPPTLLVYVPILTG